MKKIYLILFKLLIVQIVWGQDPQFTQFYASPLYHNPAFTGSAYAPRIMMNYRNQWPSLNANFVTTLFSIDHFIEKANSGIGLMFLNDKQGFNLTNSEIRLLYSYEMKINNENAVRFGLNGGYSFKGLFPNGLIFGDQLDNNGFTGNPSDDPLANSNTQRINNLDVGAGVLYFNPKYFVGVSMNHITEPKLSFFKDNTGNTSRLPRILIVNGGYNIDLSYLISRGPSDREFSLTPTFLYKKQGQFSQLDIGAYMTYTPFTVGLQYRGIPFGKVFNRFPNQDALSAMIGIRNETFSIGYSYDLTISGLGASSGGSHEISISYQLPRPEFEKTNRLKSRKKMLKCPTF